MASLKPLIVRSNRLLGASLVEKGLVSIDDLDEANDRLAKFDSSDSNSMQVSLLSILVSEKQSISEDDLLELLVEDHGLGLVDVRNVEYPDSLKKTLDTKVCWATLTVPFDHLEDTTYLASAYYLSPAARTYWEEKLDGHVVWFASTVESLTDFLEKFESSVVGAATN